MRNPPIYTSEPMATRALAAEIRHSPAAFTHFLADRTEIAGLGDLQSVHCEARERVDIELGFGTPKGFAVGIEAKFDHELTVEQITRQLGVLDHLVVLLPAEEHAPSWLTTLKRVSIMTWTEALACFGDSRLTVEDIASIPILKSTVEATFRAQRLDERLPDGWRVDVQRGGGGMPAIEIESPSLPSGRTLRGQIQIAGRRMPALGMPVPIEYSIGVSVAATEEEYPDPTLPHDEPDWIAPLRTLHREILDGEEKRLLVSTRKPGNGLSELGQRKLPLVNKHLEDTQWLAKGYTDGWALGIKSVKLPLEELTDIVSATVEIFTGWHEAESARLATGSAG